MFMRSFCKRRSQKHKKTDAMTVFFTLSGSARAKAAHQTLMKQTPVYRTLLDQCTIRKGFMTRGLSNNSWGIKQVVVLVCRPLENLALRIKQLQICNFHFCIAQSSLLLLLLPLSASLILIYYYGSSILFITRRYALNGF